MLSPFLQHTCLPFFCCNTTSTQDKIGEAQAKPVHAIDSRKEIGEAPATPANSSRGTVLKSVSQCQSLPLPSFALTSSRHRRASPHSAAGLYAQGGEIKPRLFNWAARAQLFLMSGIRSPSSEIKGDSFGGAGSSCNCSASKAARRLKVPKVRLQRQQQFPMAPDPLFGTGVGTGLGSGVGTGVATPAKMATGSPRVSSIGSNRQNKNPNQQQNWPD